RSPCRCVAPRRALEDAIRVSRRQILLTPPVHARRRGRPGPAPGPLGLKKPLQDQDGRRLVHQLPAPLPAQAPLQEGLFRLPGSQALIPEDQGQAEARLQAGGQLLEPGGLGSPAPVGPAGRADPQPHPPVAAGRPPPPVQRRRPPTTPTTRWRRAPPPARPSHPPACRSITPAPEATTCRGSLTARPTQRRPTSSPKRGPSAGTVTFRPPDPTTRS